MSAELSTIASLLRRSLLVAALALAACDSDPTPIVQGSSAEISEKMGLAPNGISGGTGGAIADRDNNRLGPNDKVKIIVFGQPTLTGEYSLDGNGVLAFPLVGNINANGATIMQLQKAIAAKLEPDYLINPNISAEIVTRRPFYVIGEVQKPGNYPYVSDMTAIHAVAMAGGFTYRARKNNFYIRRLDKEGTMFRVEATAGTILRAGDTLEVRERWF
jgi:polysaccharide export outer membrane protein